MKTVNHITRAIADAVTHYICMRLRFRSGVLQDDLPPRKATVCAEGCCPAKG